MYGWGHQRIRRVSRHRDYLRASRCSSKKRQGISSISALGIKNQITRNGNIWVGTSEDPEGNPALGLSTCFALLEPKYKQELE